MPAKKRNEQDKFTPEWLPDSKKNKKELPASSFVRLDRDISKNPIPTYADASTRRIVVNSSAQ